MSALRISLFGKFSVQHGGRALDGFEVHKVQELFCYLLIHRRIPHHREALANQLWEESGSANPRRNLRKTLWQLQRALDAPLSEPTAEAILTVGPDWVQVSSTASYWLDVDYFERAYELAQGIPGGKLEQSVVKRLDRATGLYRGDLLLGWYQDWCLFERERLQRMYLIMLDKLMRHCQAQGSYESGLQYGSRILAYDGARERSHRAMMRLYYLAGDRTEALRQYERCASKLWEELGVEPDTRTETLYHQIRDDRLPVSTPSDGHVQTGAGSIIATSLADLLASLRQLKLELSAHQRHVQQEIDAIESLLKKKDR